MYEIADLTVNTDEMDIDLSPQDLKGADLEYIVEKTGHLIPNWTSMVITIVNHHPSPAPLMDID